MEIIQKEDITAPRFIFDRTQELAKNVLGEAILELQYNGTNKYKGHWIDRTYLNNGSFCDLVATWIHEICHKSGGDGQAEFTYKLTDVIEALLDSMPFSNEMQTNLLALDKLFNEIK